jgi:uncharacterized protein (TIGR02118 family)
MDCFQPTQKDSASKKARDSYFRPIHRHSCLRNSDYESQYIPGEACYSLILDDQNAGETSMIRVSILYPYKDNAEFNMDYYLTIHVPLVRQKLGTALKDVSVEQGIAGGAPNSPAPFVTLCHLLFDGLVDVRSAIGCHGAELMADLPNFSNIQPTVQISEVKI